MDRSLDEIVAERKRADPSNRGRRAPPPRRSNYDYPRDGVRKSTRDDRPNLDNDWMHDRYDDEPAPRGDGYGRPSSRRNDYSNRDSPPREVDREPPPAKLRVDNLHYDLTEEDISDLFARIAPVLHATLRYDRAGRSEGVAFVTYAHVADARTAIREFDGANAKGQPIRLSLLPIGPSAGKSGPTRRDNPFDRVENPKSLFDRIEAPMSSRGGRRSESPVRRGDQDEKSNSARRGPRQGLASGTARDRRSDVSRPAPENIDRYIPGQSAGRSPRRDNRGGRRPGERREGTTGRNDRERGENGSRMVNGRPRKTQEELDAEMDDYWGNAGNGDAATAPMAAAKSRSTAGEPETGVAPASTELEEDIDMIE